MKPISKILRQTAESDGFRHIVERRHLTDAADEIDRAHEFIREVAWRFSDHAASNWSGPDVLAHVADFFGVTVAELDRLMMEAGS